MDLRDFAGTGVWDPRHLMETPHDPLSQTLRTWRVVPPPDARFRAAVWERIGLRSRQSWGHYLRAYAPAWSLAALLTLGAAAYAGHATAKARIRAERDTLVVSYLVELDPRVQALLKP